MKKLNKLVPIYKDYLWGGNKLRESYNKTNTDIYPIAESWELSTHPDGISKIDNIFLSDFIKNHPTCLGKKCNTNDIPILIKYIDASDKISIQVHPDDTYARVHENDNGKTELWYVLDAEEDAYIYLGTNKTLSKDEFKASITNNTVTNYLNKIYVKKGDVFLIEPGTIHSLGAGCLVAEIQERSNITYRVYDYDRKDKYGHLRKLQIQKALDVVNLTQYIPSKRNISSKDIQLLEACDYFKVYLYESLRETTIHQTKDSFAVLMLIEGSATLTTANESIEVIQGNSVFLPADDYDVTISRNNKFLLVTL